MREVLCRNWGTTMSDEIYERVKGVFRTILSEKQFAAFHPEASMDDIDGWDSMTHLELIVGLESEFNRRIDGLDAASMIYVPVIVEYFRA
jgi:acyl carrier protein